jgi:hypothetical protein
VTPPNQPPPLPPAIADCVTVTKPAQPDAAAQQFTHRLARAGDGKTRVDSGTSSVIMDPAKGRTILLDHIKKEAQIVPMQPPETPQMPGGMPNLAPPSLPKPPGPLHVQDLGKGFIEGHEVDGKRFITPPTMPEIPQMPQLPGMPGTPQPPAPPQVPTVSDIWTSTKLKLPVLTKTTGSFGEQTCHCRCAEIPEPNPSVFEIPPDYKVAAPPAPPEMPKPPQMPKAPSIPKL